MPQFVLLEHVWDGVHYDFMLEAWPGGPLKTWAIDTEVVPDRDLPAKSLPDHRAAYLDFEGAISGGRGIVKRIDRGEYEVVEWTDESVRVRIKEGQICGEVALWKVRGEETSAWIFRLGKRN